MKSVLFAWILVVASFAIVSHPVAAQEGEDAAEADCSEGCPVKPESKEREVGVVLTDYQGNRAFLPGTRLFANDAGPPCNYAVPLSSTQLEELSAKGETTAVVPAACSTILFVYREEVNALELRNRETGEIFVREVKEYSMPLSLEDDAYRSQSLRPRVVNLPETVADSGNGIAIASVLRWVALAALLAALASGAMRVRQLRRKGDATAVQ